MTWMKILEARERARVWRANNGAQHRASVKGWIGRNREKHNSYVRSTYASDPEKAIADKLEWRYENREKVRLYEQTRRFRKSNLSGVVSPDIIKQLWIKQDGYCAYNLLCHSDLYIEGFHLDHIMPLALGGKHEDDNLQLCCPRCNLSKGAKHPIDFLNSL